MHGGDDCRGRVRCQEHEREGRPQDASWNGTPAIVAAGGVGTATRAGLGLELVGSLVRMGAELTRRHRWRGKRCRPAVLLAEPRRYSSS